STTPPTRSACALRGSSRCRSRTAHGCTWTRTRPPRPAFLSDSIRLSREAAGHHAEAVERPRASRRDEALLALLPARVLLRGALRRAVARAIRCDRACLVAHGAVREVLRVPVFGALLARRVA